MIKTVFKAKNFRFGGRCAEWNEAITEGLYNGAEQAFFGKQGSHEHIIRWNVPGSFELIYGCKKMLSKLKT
jgi:6,7-dimethyl-8-ribityllumazine synthase